MGLLTGLHVRYDKKSLFPRRGIASEGYREGGYVGLWNEMRRVAKGCSEGRQMVSTDRGRSRVVHAEMT